MSAPQITVMCAVSLDGRLAPEANASSRPFGEHIPDHFTRELLDLREEVESIVVGRRTIQLDDSSLVPESGKELIRIVADTSGSLSFDRTVFTDDHPLVVAVSELTPAEYIDAIEQRENKRTAVLGEDRIEPEALHSFLGEIGVDHILLEGGGEMIHSFLNADLIDQMRVLYIPYLVGRQEATSLVDGESSLYDRGPVDVCRRESIGGYTLVEFEP